MRSVSIILTQTFILSNLVFAAPDALKPAPADAAAKAQVVVTDPEAIVVSRDFGLVKSKFTGSTGKLIIHIQDAHCNYEAQTNIAKLLEGFIKNDGLALVSVEGADGFIDTTWFKAFPDDEVRKEVATYFMKKGEITGPEFLSITTDLPFKLYGAETREYYIQNLNAFTSSYPLKADTEKYYNQIKSLLNKLKGFIYNEDLKKMDDRMAQYEDKKVQFNDYIRFLQLQAERQKINLRQYDNLFKLISVLIYEKKINFNVVDKERSAVIDELSKLISKDTLTELVSKSLEFKVGKISSVEFYDYLKSLILKNNIDIQKTYPNLYNYIIYNSVYSRIENEKLFADIKKVESALKEKYFQNDDQRTLEKLSRHVDTILGLINIKLLNADYEYYKTHKDEFKPEAFSDFIKAKAVQFGLAYDLDQPSDAVLTAVPKLEDFYAIAIKRDKALVDNTLKSMEKENVKIAVLVTGGFHSEGMSKLLEKEGVSYLVVCPNITKNEPNRYIEILTNQKTSFEDLLVGAAEPKKGMLAPFSIAEAVKLNSKELNKLSQSIVNAPLTRRVNDLKAGWENLHVKAWLGRALRYADQHQYKHDAGLMKRAYEIAFEKRLSIMVASGLSLDNTKKRAILAEVNKIIDQHYETVAKSGAVQGMAPGKASEVTLAQAYQSPDKFVKYAEARVEDLFRACPDLQQMMKDYQEKYRAEQDNYLLSLKGYVYGAVGVDEDSVRPIVDFVQLAKGYGIDVPKKISSAAIMIGKLLDEAEDAEAKGKLEKITDAHRNARRFLAEHSELVTKLKTYYELDKTREKFAKSIDNYIRNNYNAKVVEKYLGDLSDLREADVVRDITKLEDFMKTPKYEQYLAKARNLTVNSAIGKIDVWAGAASRLFGEGQNVDPKLSFAAHDVYEVARANKVDAAKLASAKFNISMATRHMVQEWLNIEDVLKDTYKAQGIAKTDKEIQDERKDIVRKTVRMVIVNDESGESIINEFVRNNFFGHDPELIVFVAQSTYNGFIKEDGVVKLIDTSRPLPVGHGDASMQSLQMNGAFTVDAKGNVKRITRDPVDYLHEKTKGRVQLYIESRVNDMLKLGYSVGKHPELTVNQVDMGILALVLSRMGDLNDIKSGNNSIFEQVGQDMDNPIKGASPIRHNGKEALLEGIGQSDDVAKIVQREGVPFNRFFVFYKAKALANIVKRNGVPLYFRFRDGFIYPETVTSDVTMLDGMNAGYVVEMSRQITDYKDTKTLGNGLSAALKQDNDPRFVAAIDEMKQMANSVSVTGLEKIPGFSDTVGAIRLNGGGVSDVDHGARGADAKSAEALAKATLNGAIGSIAANQVEGAFMYSLVQGAAWKALDGDVTIKPADSVKDLSRLGTKARVEAFLYSAFYGELKVSNKNLVVVKGLKTELQRRGAPTDIIFHYGVSRNQTYIDEDDLIYLLSLPNGVELIMEALRHEIAHIENPTLDEAAIEKMAPTKNVRLAFTAHDAVTNMAMQVASLGINKIEVLTLGDNENIVNKIAKIGGTTPKKLGDVILLIAQQPDAFQKVLDAREWLCLFRAILIKCGSINKAMGIFRFLLRQPGVADLVPSGFFNMLVEARDDGGPAGSYMSDREIESMMRGLDLRRYPTVGSVFAAIKKAGSVQRFLENIKIDSTKFELFEQISYIAPQYVSLQDLVNNKDTYCRRSAICVLMDLSLVMREEVEGDDKKLKYLRGLIDLGFKTLGDVVYAMGDERFMDGSSVNFSAWQYGGDRNTIVLAANPTIKAVRDEAAGRFIVGVGLAVGAIRLNGGGVSEVDHGARGADAKSAEALAKATLNGAIGSILATHKFGEAYSLGGRSIPQIGDNTIYNYGDDDESLSIKCRDLSKGNDKIARNFYLAITELFNSQSGYSFVVLKGLKAELKKRNAGASDVIFHYGVSRKQIYVDEDDLAYLLSLPNGVELIMEALRHEIAHIENPTLDEAAIEKMAPTKNVRLAFIERDFAALKAAAGAANAVAVWEGVVDQFGRIADPVAGLAELFGALDKQGKKDYKAQIKRFNEILVERSILARDAAGKILALNDAEFLGRIRQLADSMIVSFQNDQVVKGKTKEAKAQDQINSARVLMGQILDPQNKLPAHVVQGVYRAMLEGRSADLLFVFERWRQFGTAGIRNPAVQSSFPAIQKQELKEFNESPFAPVLVGQNTINSVTLLQQVASLISIMKNVQERLNRGEDLTGEFDQEFLDDVQNNRMTIAYDSRINGAYFAKLLAAAVLNRGIKVDLFDNAAGVPHLAWAAKNEHSAFGILISASHSEANYNGFKVYVGYQKAQVDEKFKDLIVDARSDSYADMQLNLATEAGWADVENTLRNTGNLRWIGDENRRKIGPDNAKKSSWEKIDYYGRDKETDFIKFYPGYYKMIKERSPLNMLDNETRAAVERHKREHPLKVLYTAFFGVGATPAANFPGFLDKVGYVKKDVDTVEAQTDIMNGMFPGHESPDPGIVQGWLSNLLDYFIQNGGEGLKLRGIERAVDALNTRNVGIATDPDIDRAGMMIDLPMGAQGNIKSPLIATIRNYLEERGMDMDEKEGQEILAYMERNLNDKLLLTANEAWTFMVYWKLKMMEENNMLEKDRVYVIEKSHVTTEALERVAKMYRDKGYLVYVVDTYVGFTEIGKKGRELFAIAKAAHELSETLKQGLINDTVVRAQLQVLEAANAQLKTNVPYENAGIPIVDIAIAHINEMLNTADKDKKGRIAQGAQRYFYALSRMHILAGVEESNGYGELGRWNPEKGEVELGHINDKDGSLAAFEFLELLSYGSYKRMTAYDMFQNLTESIGQVCTVNSALYHPGLTGVEAKLNEMEGIEKMFAYALQKRLDNGDKVTLFNGKYTVNRVQIFRDGKYDTEFRGFTEEGVRLLMTTKTGSEVIVTYRPSGTGDSIRVYSWLLAEPPKYGIKNSDKQQHVKDFENYRKMIEGETADMVRDFFGVDRQDTGYADLPIAYFYGLMSSLKEGGYRRQPELFGKAMGANTVVLSDIEQKTMDATSAFARAARTLKKAEEVRTNAPILTETRSANRAAWAEYLAAPETQAVPADSKFNFEIAGKTVAAIPRAAGTAWQAGLVDYLVGLLQSAGTKEFTINDAELTVLINKQLNEPPATATPPATPPTLLPPVPSPDLYGMESAAEGTGGDTTAAARSHGAPSSNGTGRQGRAILEAAGMTELLTAEEIDDRFSKPYTEELKGTLDSLEVANAHVDNEIVIIATDTGMAGGRADTEMLRAVQTIDRVISNRGLQKTVLNVRGTGQDLYDEVQSLVQRITSGTDTEFGQGKSVKAIVTIAGNRTSTLVAEKMQKLADRSWVLNVQPTNGLRHISMPAFYNLAFILAYDMPTDQLRACIGGIGRVLGEDNKPLDLANIIEAIKTGAMKLIRILPIIAPKNIDADATAHTLAKKALETSL